MDYSTISLLDLIKLIHERKLDVDTTRPRRTRDEIKEVRERLIAALEAVDATCPLLFKLPPEIRIMIWELLVHTGDIDTCHPQILATCRQINEEARGFLLDNRLTIRVDEGQIFVGKRPFGSPVLQNPILQDAIRDLRSIRWPAFLKAVRTMRIELSANPYLPIDPARDEIVPPSVWFSYDVQPLSLLNNVLYTLCDSLVDENRLQTLEIDVTAYELRTGRITSSYVYRRPLFPLAMLDNLTNLVIAGNEQKTADRILEAVKPHAHPDRGLLRRFDVEMDEARLCQAAFDMLRFRTPWASSLERCLAETRDLLLLSPSWHDMANRQWEEKYREAGMSLRETLKDKGGSAELEEKFLRETEPMRDSLRKIRERHGV